MVEQDSADGCRPVSADRQSPGVAGVANATRAVARAGIGTGDVTFHTLRHTALSCVIASGIDDFTVMAISGHRSVRMLERYTHPTDARKLDALETGASLVTIWSQRGPTPLRAGRERKEMRKLLKEVGLPTEACVGE